MGIRWAHQSAPRRRCANRRTRTQRRLTAQQIAPKRGSHEVASTENPASRLLLGVKAGSYRRRERLLQYVLAVRAPCPSRRSMAWRKDERRFPPIWKAMSEPTSRPKAPPSKTPSTKKRFRNDNIGVTCSCLTTACTLLPERRSTTVPGCRTHAPSVQRYARLRHRNRATSIRCSRRLHSHGLEHPGRPASL